MKEMLKTVIMTRLDEMKLNVGANVPDAEIVEDYDRGRWDAFHTVLKDMEVISRIEEQDAKAQEFVTEGTY